MPKSPVFIVGSPRSGTSILVSALRNVGYQGYAEGNFLPLITLIGKVVDRHIAVFGKANPNVLAGQIDAKLLKARIEEVIKEFTETLNTGPLWFDKSGNADMIRAIPTLRRLWPESIFIFAKRRAIENVVSRLKKFPAHDFDYHCIDWAKNMACWRDIRAKLPADAYLEVDQQDLIRSTEEIASKIGRFLGLPDEQMIRIVKTFTSFRPQETTKGSAAMTYSIDSLGWPAAQMEIFRKHCGAEMREYGYSEDTAYYRKT